MRVAVDIGGTFTDVVVFDEGNASLALAKALSTPAELDDYFKRLDEAQIGGQITRILEAEGIAIQAPGTSSARA